MFFLKPAVTFFGRGIAILAKNVGKKKQFFICIYKVITITSSIEASLWCCDRVNKIPPHYLLERISELLAIKNQYVKKIEHYTWRKNSNGSHEK